MPVLPAPGVHHRNFLSRHGEPTAASTPAPAIHQRLSYGADGYDAQLRHRINLALCSDELSQRPKMVLTLAAIGYASSFGNSATRHFLTRGQNAVFEGVFGRLVTGMENGLSKVFSVCSRRRVALPDEETGQGQAVQGDSQGRVIDNVWARRVTLPLRVAIEAGASIATLLSIAIGVGMAAVTLVVASLASAVIIGAVAYDTPAFFVWFVSGALRTGLKVVFKLEAFSDGVSQSAPLASRRHHLLALPEQQPISLDEAFAQLAQTTQDVRQDDPECRALETRDEVRDAFTTLQLALSHHASLQSPEQIHVQA